MASDRSRALGLAIFGLFGVTGPIAADALPEGLIFQPPLARDVAALPRLAGSGGAADKVNARLDALDRSTLAAMSDCEDGPYRFWERWVDVTLATSGFLGLVSHSAFYCSGAAHPESFINAVTFDLAVGSEVDWSEFFPSDLRNPKDFSIASTVLRGSLRLTDAYVEQNAAINAECREIVAGRPHDFVVYPDGRSASLVLIPVDLAYAVKACADPVAIPVPILRTLGVSHPILDALSVE
ncbi:hypothetical protein EI545_07355 [Tabrizicola piscis]|uniref:DUF3298 domain-containing protein n=1 Tax=Tabrizicola piscis TaxID=2494374 RepID=A0A3S8U527_9RHOB|nr:hypothetical protein [Tabrizicola piscis]AZL58668.1 hypothetical protein EI545_07355 [Tabrizicola piscis]